MHDAHYYESFDISIRITTKMESVLLVIFSLFHSSYCNFSIFLALQHGQIMFTLFTYNRQYHRYDLPPLV